MKTSEQRYQEYSSHSLSSEYFAINTDSSTNRLSTEQSDSSIITKVCSNSKTMVAELTMKLSELGV
jgi:hypothetical protein